MIHNPTSLKKQALLAGGIIAGIMLTTSTVRAQFTTGNVVVLQVGDGTTALSNAAAPLFLKEFNTSTAGQTTAVSSVTIPATGSARLTISGSATSEGQVTLSSDSTRIVIAGYDAAPATTGVAGTTSTAVPRAIDTVGSSGMPGRADTTQSAFSGNNIRSATRNGAENYWAAGGNTGTYYMGNLSTPAVIQTLATNTRVIVAANNKLYFITTTGTPRLLRINSQPSTTAAVDTLIQLGATASPYGFAVNSAESVVYVADDRTAAGGGIQKWTLSGTTWSLAYTLSVGTATGARSVIADWSGTAPTLYAVTTVTGGSLVKLVDSNANATALTLAAGTATAVFRSVAFTPRALCTPATLSATSSAITCAANGSITLGISGGTAPFTYTWTGPGTYSASTQNITNLSAGAYTVTVSGGGCTAATSATVANNAMITAAATATGATTRCQRDSVLITANAGTGYKYQWKLNGSPLLAKDTLQAYKAGAAGSYTVTVSSGINCSATSAPVSVTVNPLPSTIISAGGSITFCTGSSVQLCAPAGTGYSYQWRLNFANIAAATSNCYTVLTSGTYKVYVTTGLGCADSSTGTVVTAGTPPPAAIKPSGTVAICQGSSVKLVTNSNTGLTYTWTRNGTALTGAGNTDSTLSVTLAGIYTVTVSSGAGCSSTSAPDTVVVNPKPATTVQMFTPAIVCAGDTISVRAAGGNANLYQWSVTGLFTSPGYPDSNYSIVTPANITTATIFGFRAIVTSPFGCKDSSAEQLVTVNPLPLPVIVNNGGLLNAGFYSSYQWYRNGVAIPGVTGSLYTPAVNGDYTVRVTNANGCSNTSPAVTITGLGAGNWLVQQGIRIYPNPAQDVVRIDAPYTVSAVVKDVQGREVAQVIHAKQLSVGALSNGVYSITLYSAAGTPIGTQLIVKGSY